MTPSINDYREVVLNHGKVALVSPEDYERVIQHRWGVVEIRGKMYARRSVGQTNQYMHRFLLGLVPGDRREADHANGKTLDNRRSNLRIASHADNMRNVRRKRNNRCGFKGVEIGHGAVIKFKARITYQGERIHLGMFSTPEEAHAAYCEAAVRYFGAYARFE